MPRNQIKHLSGKSGDLQASLVLWLAGVHGRLVDWMCRLQANTETRKPVLSTVFIGSQVLRLPELRVSTADLLIALTELRAMILRASAC